MKDNFVYPESSYVLPDDIPSPINKINEFKDINYRQKDEI